MSTCNPSEWARSVSYALQKTRYVSLCSTAALHPGFATCPSTRVGHEFEEEGTPRGQLAYSIASSPVQLTGTMVAVKKM
jgi:hypothetical protein